MYRIVYALLCSLPLSFGSTLVVAEDWPQWMGPNRNGTFSEPDIIDRIPEDGLPLLWKTPINGGFSGPAIVDGRVYVTDFIVTSGDAVYTQDTQPKLQGEERVLCLDAATGKVIWQRSDPCNYEISFPTGPRCTPTIDGDIVVTLGAQGDLRVFSKDNGAPKWHVSIPEQFNTSVPFWGFSAHPLVTEDLVITMVGGDGQAVVAFDRTSGQVRWKALTSVDAGYCPPSLIEAGGQTQLIVFHPGGVAALDPTNGQVLWTVPLEADYGMSVARPQRDGDLLYVSAYQRKSLMLRLDPDKPAVTEVWSSTNVQAIDSAVVTPILHDGVIYGCDDQAGGLIAASAADGKRLWQELEPVRPGLQRPLSSGTVFVTRHTPSGKYFLFGEAGYLTLAEMSADQYVAHGSTQLIEPTVTASGRKVVWTHPAYANGTIVVRNDQEIAAYSLRK